MGDVNRDKLAMALCRAMLRPDAYCKATGCTEKCLDWPLQHERELGALLDELRAAGLAVVPIVPTVVMLRATDSHPDAGHFWRDMLAAGEVK